MKIREGVNQSKRKKHDKFEKSKWGQRTIQFVKTVTGLESQNSDNIKSTNGDRLQKSKWC